MPASGVSAVSAPTSVNAPTGSPSASAQICAMTVFEPWPMSIAPWCSTRAPSGRSPRRMVEGLGMRGVAAAVPAGGDPDAVPQPAAGGVGRRGLGERAAPRAPAAPRGSRRSRRRAAAGRWRWRRRRGGRSAGGTPAGRGRRRRRAGRSAISGADGRLRHAEAAEGAGDRVVGVDRPRPRQRRAARGRGRWHAPARGSPRSGPSSRRAPVSKTPSKSSAVSRPVGVAAEPRRDPRRVPLGGRRHRLGAA